MFYIMDLKQDQWYIVTRNINYQRLARIFDDEQRETINKLMSLGFMPIITTSGKGRCTRKHWNIEPYNGKHGDGYRMITAYNNRDQFGNFRPSRLNSITYFIKPKDAQ